MSAPLSTHHGGHSALDDLLARLTICESSIDVTQVDHSSVGSPAFVVSVSQTNRLQSTPGRKLVSLGDVDNLVQEKDSGRRSTPPTVLPAVKERVTPALPLPRLVCNKENNVTELVAHSSTIMPAAPNGVGKPDIVSVNQAAHEAQKAALQRRTRPRGLSRTLSLPTIHSPHRSISEELQALRNTSFPIFQDQTPVSNKKIISSSPTLEDNDLRRRLEESLACIEGKNFLYYVVLRTNSTDMKQEMHSLRLALSQQSLVDIPTHHSGPESTLTAAPPRRGSTTPLPPPENVEAARIFAPAAQSHPSMSRSFISPFLPPSSPSNELFGTTSSLSAASIEHISFFPTTRGTMTPSLSADSPSFVPGSNFSALESSGAYSTLGSNHRALTIDLDQMSRVSSTDMASQYDYASTVLDGGSTIEVSGAASPWLYFVERVINQNDQPASVALQQRLKTALPEQKNDIFRAIFSRVLLLITNRFGNFLIQRCFEHGNSEHIHDLGEIICENVVSLACDAFGCHVVQKALDNVSDHQKRRIVTGLSEDISGTITHRHACHVWQKLFEIRWDDPVPVFMQGINRELAGLWQDVALSETGSLVVQNIFENCTKEDALPSRLEILESVDAIIRGQWGNWVIQHIIEHGPDTDREHVLKVVFARTVEYSTDQFASKVLEKAIKANAPGMIARYLEAITTVPANNRGRPRLPLIDIASDQYGNYLIHHILQFGSSEQRRIVSCAVRKHMVSMRGSRYGARIAFAVERLRYDGSDSARLASQLEATDHSERLPTDFSREAATYLTRSTGPGGSRTPSETHDQVSGAGRATRYLSRSYN
ncbi:hypothetical protein PYCC9005_003148 [Savitreella phatthalungensis]